jgi:hypothetical protein
MAREQNRAVPLPEAAASWYDHVYHPIAEAIRKHRVLELMPGWTEADLYVEITRRWLELGEGGQATGPDPAIESLLAEHTQRWWDLRGKLRIPNPRLRERDT